MYCNAADLKPCTQREGKLPLPPAYRAKDKSSGGAPSSQEATPGSLPQISARDPVDCTAEGGGPSSRRRRRRCSSTSAAELSAASSLTSRPHTCRSGRTPLRLPNSASEGAAGLASVWRGRGRRDRCHVPCHRREGVGRGRAGGRSCSAQTLERRRGGLEWPTNPCRGGCRGTGPPLSYWLQRFLRR